MQTKNSSLPTLAIALTLTLAFFNPVSTDLRAASFDFTARAYGGITGFGTVTYPEEFLGGEDEGEVESITLTPSDGLTITFELFN